MKPAIQRYVKFIGNVATVCRIVLFLMLMVSLVIGLNGYIGFLMIAGFSLVAFFVVHGVYALHFSMGTVLGVELTPEVIHLKTKRKTFTYDAAGGCIAVKELSNRYICTFQTQDSVDKFTFYKRVPFAKPFESGFTEEEIARFYPPLAGDVFE